jgi:hypothetical protein
MTALAVVNAVLVLFFLRIWRGFIPYSNFII